MRDASYVERRDRIEHYFDRTAPHYVQLAGRHRASLAGGP